MTDLFEPYSSKPFFVAAVQVGLLNMQELAKICGGEVLSDGEKEGHFSREYIKVSVRRPFNDRQTQAYVGDWLVRQGNTFKVYPDKQFRGKFDRREEGDVVDGAVRHAKPNPKNRGKVNRIDHRDAATSAPRSPSPSQMPKKKPAGTPVSSDEIKSLPLVEEDPKKHNHGSHLRCDASKCGVDRYADGVHVFADKTLNVLPETEGEPRVAEVVTLTSEQEEAPLLDQTFETKTSGTIPEDRKAITLDELNSMAGDDRTALDIHREGLRAGGA